MTSFNFVKPSSSSQPSDATSTPAPAAGSLFGAVTAPTKTVFCFSPLGGTANATGPASTGGFAPEQQQQQQQQQQGADGNAQKPDATSSAPTLPFGASAPSTGTLFGANSSATPSSTGNPFGTMNPATSTPTTLTPKAGGLFGNLTGKPATNLFGAAAGSATPGGGSILSQKNDQSSAFTAAASTPAKPMFPLASTTPAGAPPADSSQPAASSSLQVTAPASSQGLFSLAKAGSNAPGAGESVLGSNSAAPPAGGLLGNLGGNLAPGSSPAPAAEGSATPKLGSSLFGGMTTAPAAAGATTIGSGLFGSATATSTASTTGATKAPSGGMFGNTSTPAATTSAATPATSSTSAGLFGNAQPTASASASNTASSLFGAPAAASASQPTSAGGPTVAAGGLFGAKPATGGTSQTAGGLFGAKTATEGVDKAQDGQPAKPAAQNGTAGALGASTSGPTSQMPRLKNKTMEDIITRWASDLAKYQKDFKEQATVVSTWDRNLVNNGEKIQKLYLDTFEAERASHEIERQLAAVESQQDELEAWLDRYEAEVQDMFVKQVGPGEQLAGPDQERERTYKLAEKLTQQLDEKSRDLSKMVKDINDISGSLTKGAKVEDPLSQIVRVLNGHLTQLQWIDAHAAALQAKVAAAQKSSVALNSHYAGVENDAAESFYRSYMGRR
ncbi:hypothetical protein XA68_16302 [Ophiocordyceps unilateralis]|uniref:Nucleoporin NSP1 n=1 Tax=Ophiocordyceps unilateralis TaxID=268505 RepID=A0A2A9PLK4_OPHUN|nr:hypothetical protein XA68_16302 [Ophiocordyceps unilateralis]